MFRTVTTIAFGFGFYLLLAGAVGAEQLVSAAVMTVIVRIWSTVLRVKGGPRRFAFTTAHVWPWGRAIARIPEDTARIGSMLCKAAIIGGSPGHAAVRAFRYGPLDDPVEAARRASAVVAGSLTPDAFIVDIAPGKSSALLHKLATTPASDRAEWLA